MEARLYETSLDALELEVVRQITIMESESLQHADDGAIGDPSSEEEIDHIVLVAQRTPPHLRQGIEKRTSQIGVSKAEWNAEHQEQQHQSNDAGLPGSEFA